MGRAPAGPSTRRAEFVCIRTVYAQRCFVHGRSTSPRTCKLRERLSSGSHSHYTLHVRTLKRRSDPRAHPREPFGFSSADHDWRSRSSPIRSSDQTPRRVIPVEVPPRAFDCVRPNSREQISQDTDSWRLSSRSDAEDALRVRHHRPRGRADHTHGPSATEALCAQRRRWYGRTSHFGASFAPSTRRMQERVPGRLGGGRVRLLM
jgi:hypothetical protein